jgi:hypothetical protein
MLLFAVSAVVGRSSASSRAPDRIRVSEGRIQQLRETWTARWGSPPDAQQLETLIADFVREEVLYREAVASGLDRDDTIIRRHLARKVEFLAQGVAVMTPPSEAELAAFFAAHRAHYRLAATITFTHIYFSTSTRGEAASGAAIAALRRLRTASPASDAVSLGDPFMLQADYPLITRDEIRDQFGGEFADAVFRLPVGEWGGPLASSYGLHLVRLSERSEERDPLLEDVRDQVLNDLNDERVRTAVDADYARLRTRYRIEVDAHTVVSR